MNAYTVSHLALDAGVSVHVVRDYMLRGLLWPVACTAGGYGLFDAAPLPRLCFVRAAFQAGIGLDALARLCRALDAADGDGAAMQLVPCCVSSSNAGARPWPASKCSWPQCQPSRHNMRKVCHEQPRAHAGRDAQAVDRLSVGRTGRAYLSLPSADSRRRSCRHDRRRIHRGALGCCSPRADRLVCPVRDAAASGLQGKIMTASLPIKSRHLEICYKSGVSPRTQISRTLPVAPPAANAAKKFRSMPPSPRKARNTSSTSAGWIAMNASWHAPRPPQNPALRLFLTVRSRQVEAYPNLMSGLARNLDDLRCLVQKLTKRGVCIEFVTLPVHHHTRHLARLYNCH